MDIMTKAQAEAWMRAWEGHPRRGIAAETVRGLRRAAAICRSNPTRYSEETVRGYEEAAGLIEREAFSRP